jgi:hypothetical protein
MNTLSAKEIVGLALRLPGYRIILRGKRTNDGLMRQIQEVARKECKEKIVKSNGEELILGDGGSKNYELAKCSRIRFMPPAANLVRGFKCDLVLNLDDSMKT